MKASDIQVGKKYWVKAIDDSARPMLVYKKSETEPCLFECVGADGKRFGVFPESFIRSVEAEAVAS